MGAGSCSSVGKMLSQPRTLFLLLSLSVLCSADEYDSRTKRNIIFPLGGTYCQLITGIGVPIPLERHSVTMGVVMKYNYNLPQNATELVQPYIDSFGRQQRNTPVRWKIYEGLEEILSSFGSNVDSHQCLLRMICEASAVPFDHNSGLAAELMHILLTPSTSNEVEGLRPERDYLAAELRGRKGLAACAAFKKSCPLPFLEMLSRLTSLQQ